MLRRDGGAYTCVTFGVYIYSLAGLLIVVLLWVLFTTCHLCSHGDTCRVSGNCVCRHLTSASFASTLESGRLVK